MVGRIPKTSRFYTTVSRHTICSCLKPETWRKCCKELLKAASNFDVSELRIARISHLCRSRQELCKFTSRCLRSVNYYLKAVNSHRFNQSDLDTRSWYHGTAPSMECLQAPLCTPSSPDRSRFIPLAQDYTRLARPKPNREPVRRLCTPAMHTGWRCRRFEGLKA